MRKQFCVEFVCLGLFLAWIDSNIDLKFMNNTYLNEASSLDRNKMTENLLKFDQKIFTAMNLIFLTWPKFMTPTNINLFLTFSSNKKSISAVGFYWNPLMEVSAIFSHWYLCRNRYNMCQVWKCYEKCHKKKILSNQIDKYKTGASISFLSLGNRRQTLALCYFFDRGIHIITCRIYVTPLPVFPV